MRRATSPDRSAIVRRSSPSGSPSISARKARTASVSTLQLGSQIFPPCRGRLVKSDCGLRVYDLPATESACDACPQNDRLHRISGVSPVGEQQGVWIRTPIGDDGDRGISCRGAGSARDDKSRREARCAAAPAAMTPASRISENTRAVAPHPQPSALLSPRHRRRGWRSCCRARQQIVGVSSSRRAGVVHNRWPLAM